MTAISITEITEGSLVGTGSFDKIMSAMQLRLEEEFIQGRITGDDYANVYLGAMTASMQQAVAFVLGKQTADSQAELTKAQALEVNAQTALVAQQKVNLVSENINIGKQGLQIDAQTALVGQQKANLIAEVANTPKQGLLIDAQKLDVEAKTCNIIAERLNIPKQGALLDAQTLNTIKQVDIAIAEIAIKTQQVLESIENVSIARAKLVNIPKEGALLDAQVSNTTKQGLLVDVQKAEVTAQTAGINADILNKPKQGALLDQQVVTAQADAINKVKEGVVLDRQGTKILAEELLLKHKAITEQAQYGDNVTSILGTTVAVTGVVGKQKLLYNAQTEGFARDAEQKLAKIMADTWNIRRSTDSTLPTLGTGLEDTQIKAVMDKARSSIGA